MVFLSRAICADYSKLTGWGGAPDIDFGRRELVLCPSRIFERGRPAKPCLRPSRWPLRLWIVALVVFLLNVPFGYWRAKVRKFSVQWVLAIHVPVPFIIGLRIFSGLGWHFITFPVLIGAFFLGQFFGGRIHRWHVTARQIRRHPPAGR